MFEGFDFTALAFLLSAISTAASAGAWIYVHLSRRHAATDEQLKALEARVGVAETRLEMLPTVHSWSDMREEIAKISGGVDRTATEIHGLGKGLDRVERQVGLLMENELRGSRE